MPLLTAVSGSARQLFLLLRCISFAPKAQIKISQEGLRFSVDHAQVMQGFAFLDKGLFTTFRYEPRVRDEDDQSDSEAEPPIFQIALNALLETLQIFGSNDLKDRWSTRDPYSSGINSSYARASAANGAFDNRVLGLQGLCRITYEDHGSPLCITLEEGNVKTTCELVTYEADETSDIPFDREQLALKIIMRAQLLHDAIVELASATPERITLTASPIAPHLSFSAVGPLGSATIEFANEPSLLETFQVRRKTANTYKFSMIRSASKAMASAAKVSIRGDSQGVLSLQFMVEVETSNGPGASFVDFKFVPFVPEDGEEQGDEEDGETQVDDEDGSDGD